MSSKRAKTFPVTHNLLVNVVFEGPFSNDKINNNLLELYLEYKKDDLILSPNLCYKKCVIQFQRS